MLLPKGKWEVSIFYHMTNLSLHCNRTQHHPIEEQNRPKDRYIKYGEECCYESNAKCFSNRIPELELGEAANERAELIRRAGGEDGATIGIKRVMDLGIDLGREEGDEDVEDVDAERVGDNIIPLGEPNANGVDDGNRSEP